MKTKAIFLISLLLASIAAQAADTLPIGKWTVEKVTIEKTTDGNTQTTVYNTAAEVKSYIRCPQDWEISAQDITLSYANDVKEVAGYTYTVEGNQLTIQSTRIQSYQYSIKGGTLILTAFYNYVNNLPTGQAEHITEHWTITLKEQ